MRSAVVFAAALVAAPSLASAGTYVSLGLGLDPSGQGELALMTETADTDTPAMPTRFHSLIVWRALTEYGGYDAASEVFQRADRNYTMAMPALLQSQLPQRWIAARGLA